MYISVCEDDLFQYVCTCKKVGSLLYTSEEPHHLCMY